MRKLNFKKIIAGAVALFMCAPVMSSVQVSNYSIDANAVLLRSGDFYFDNKTGTIKKYIGEGGNVVIPSVIDGVAVTSIDGSSFSKCTNLTSITIPDSIISIGDHAFSECSSLESIILPNSVTSVGAFAFLECSSLTSITIPDSVTDIGGCAFYYTPWLEEKQKENPLVVINGILINGTNCEGDVIIPNSVTSIGDDAFEYNSKITSLTIPSSVKSIGKKSFNNCYGLTSLTIPDSVTSIGYCAFEYCSHLLSLKISNSVKNIEMYAFDGCSSLVSISIPDSVENIGKYAFGGCHELEVITIPDSVKKIELSAFGGCNKIKDVYYVGTEEQWNHIEIDTNEYLTNAKIHFNSKAPEPVVTTIATTTATKSTTTSSSTTVAIKTVKGDANCNGTVEIADAVAILQYLANSAKYPLSEQGKKNADVDGVAGVSGLDALTIQKFDAKVIDKL